MFASLLKPQLTAVAAGLFLALAGTASAGNVTILNCSNLAGLQVASYNSNDAVRAIAFKDACIRGRGKSVTLSCATAACQVKVWTNCPAALGALVSERAVSGTQFFYNGKMYSMSDVAKEAAAKGYVRAGTKSLSCDQIDKLAPQLR